MNKFNQLAVNQGEKYLRKLESLIGQSSLVGDVPFFETTQFSWVENLEANWTMIRDELDTILESIDQVPNFQDISPDQYSITQDNRWKTFFFMLTGLKLL
jgi:beta-hydroxylase